MTERPKKFKYGKKRPEANVRGEGGEKVESEFS